MRNFHLRNFLTVGVCTIIICHISIGQPSTARHGKYPDKNIRVLELRNYLLREGTRPNFRDSFNLHIADLQNEKGALVLGNFTVKDAPDRFFWLRGFESMPNRQKALQEFYSSKLWEEQVRIPIAYVVNYGNVHLLKPLHFSSGVDTVRSFNSAWFKKVHGVVVIDYYTANERRNQLIEYFRNSYIAVLQKAGIRNISYWISETEPNNYPDHPVFQDKNLLVTITYFENEASYLSAMKEVALHLDTESKYEMLGIVTFHNTVILYPE